MDTPVLDPSAPAAAPAPVAPVPAPAPVAAAAPAPAPMPSSDSNSTDIKGILKGLNWVEIGFGILGTTALFYTIYYFKYNINMNKSFKVDMQNKIDDLTIKVSDLSSAVNGKELLSQPQQGFDGFNVSVSGGNSWN
jgi:hypothetical protein